MPDSLLAVVDDPRFDAHRARGAHPERPERLTAAREGLASTVPEDRRLVLPVESLPAALASTVHSPAYVERMLEVVAHGEGHLDPDTYYGAGTLEATLGAAGGAVALTDALLAGRTRVGVGLVRPPGHHARPSTAMGFCLLNNVAVAAEHARRSGAERVAIVDWDVHHGNGTQEIFYDRSDVLFVSLHQYPFYPGTGAPKEVGRGAGEGATVNVAMSEGAGPEDYAHAFTRVVLPALRRFAPDLVLVSAGFDAHARDPLAGLCLDGGTYGGMARALLDLPGEPPVAFLLEGGYDLVGLSESIASVGAAALGADLAMSEDAPGPAGRAAVAATLAAHPHLDER